MIRRIVAIATVALTALSVVSAGADAPLYEPGVISPEVGKVVSGPCTTETIFDANYDRPELPTPQRSQYIQDNCVRLKVVFGPIWAKPGQNDVLIQPVTLEKPLYDGYLTRFKPDLVGADGASPRVKDLHLHHGTWLNPGYFGSSSEYFDTPAGQVPNPGRTYGRGPWIASGEEKTVAIWPEGFGLKIKATDAWLFLHMIHNATAETFPVWVTYDLDYVAADAAEAINPETNQPHLINTEGIWLDVGDCSWSNQCEKDAFNPIFNVQRGFSVEDGDGACVFPRENCANINTLAEKSAQQGIDLGPQYDEITVNEDGTLVMMGGHLHNGGLRDDVYLVRDLNGDGVTDEETEVKLIHISDAYYFDHGIDWTQTSEESLRFDPEANLIGAPPVSWDFVMTGVTSDIGWRVNIKKGDKIRLEGVYDSTIASWYEQMGIVMTWVVPTENTGGQFIGVDPFDPNVTIDTRPNSEAVQPGTLPGYELPGSVADGSMCTNSATNLCVRGQMTHSRIQTSGDHWSCQFNGCPQFVKNAPKGQLMDNIPIGAFGFGPADLGLISAVGIPQVKVNEPVTFWNLDTPAYMWHTVTRCALPCSGTTSASYPLADGAWQDTFDPDTGLYTNPETGDTSTDPALLGPDPMDFDSGQIGVGTGANNKLDWTWTPTREGRFAFFCRIHPGMRGAVEVVA